MDESKSEEVCSRISYVCFSFHSSPLYRRATTEREEPNKEGWLIKGSSKTVFIIEQTK